MRASATASGIGDDEKELSTHRHVLHWLTEGLAMKIVIFGAAVIAGACCISATTTSAFAASAATQMFLANVSPNLDFLDRSSRFALTNSKDARMHEFAFNEAKEQTLAANALDEWAQTNKPDDVVTGRSIAVAGQVAPVADTRLPMGQEDLDSLEGLAGREFDTQYRAKQFEALRQVEADYKTYIATGDDPGLIDLAKRELPKVQRRISMLGKV